MKRERIIEELARIDGRLKKSQTLNHIEIQGTSGLVYYDCPDYLHPTEGFNHLHRIIREEAKKDPDFIGLYSDWLLLVVSEANDLDHRKQDAVDATYLATTAQMAEAILRAHDKFDEEER